MFATSRNYFLKFGPVSPLLQEGDSSALTRRQAADYFYPYATDRLEFRRPRVQLDHPKPRGVHAPRAIYSGPERKVRTMHVPGVVERVLVRRRSGIFLVTRVDHQRQLAIVIPLNGYGQAAIEVPFTELMPCLEKTVF